MFLQLVILQIVSFYQGSESAKILGIVPSASYSHQIVYRPIWRELANRGHNVTVITTHPENDPHSEVNEIQLLHVADIWSSFIEQMALESEKPFALGRVIRRLPLMVVERMMLQPQVDKLFNERNTSFDLIMTEIFYPPLFALGDMFNCPVIGLFSFDLPSDMHAIFGSSTHPILYPNVFLTIQSDVMNFWERMRSFLFTPMYKMGYCLDFESNKLESAILKRHFRMGNSSNLMQNVRMVLVNTIPALTNRAIGPSVVNIGGGLHILPAKKLPKDLANYLDSSLRGFIYISLGTNVKSTIITSDIQRIILDACAEMPYNFLWKFDIDLHDIPSNVKIAKWVPQQDVLRHPNIKAFVYQGGLQSTEEAILFHVPIVGIPFLADQMTNVKEMVKRGLCIQLDKDNLNKGSLVSAITAVIENRSYKENTINLAKLIVDQPMTALEKAVWWTEYVIRHRGAPHIREDSKNLDFIQYHLLDVISFILGIIISSVALIYITILYLFRFLRKRSQKKMKSE